MATEATSSRTKHLSRWPVWLLNLVLSTCLAVGGSSALALFQSVFGQAEEIAAFERTTLVPLEDEQQVDSAFLDRLEHALGRVERRQLSFDSAFAFASRLTREVRRDSTGQLRSPAVGPLADSVESELVRAAHLASTMAWGSSVDSATLSSLYGFPLSESKLKTIGAVSVMLGSEGAYWRKMSTVLYGIADQELTEHIQAAFIEQGWGYTTAVAGVSALMGTIRAMDARHSRSVADARTSWDRSRRHRFWLMFVKLMGLFASIQIGVPVVQEVIRRGKSAQ